MIDTERPVLAAAEAAPMRKLWLVKSPSIPILWISSLNSLQNQWWEIALPFAHFNIAPLVAGWTIRYPYNARIGHSSWLVLPSTIEHPFLKGSDFDDFNLSAAWEKSVPRERSSKQRSKWGSKEPSTVNSDTRRKPKKPIAIMAQSAVSLKWPVCNTWWILRSMETDTGERFRVGADRFFRALMTSFKRSKFEIGLMWPFSICR